MQNNTVSPSEDDGQDNKAPRLFSLAIIALICTAILISTFTLYQAAQSRQTELEVQLLGNEIGRFRRSVEVNVEKEAYFLVWLANYFQQTENTTYDRWLTVTNTMQGNFPFFDSIYWLDLDRKMKWIYPEDHPPPVEGSSGRIAPSETVNTKPVLAKLSSTQIIELPRGNAGVELLHPVTRFDHVNGYLGASYDIESMINNLAKQLLSEGQQVVVSEGGAIFFGTMPDRSGILTSSVEISVLGNQWQLTIWQPSSKRSSYFSLPMMIFVAGILVTTLVGISLYLLETNIMGRRIESYSVKKLRQQILQRREAEMQLQFTANHDPQTHLPNRHALEIYLANSARSDNDIVLMCIDLDKLQEINDMYGHEVADQLLVLAAKRFRTVLPPHAVLARVSSDQFMVACAGMSQLEAEMQANHLRVCLEEEFILDENDILTSCAIGIAYRYSQDMKANELLRHAETAAHKAKTFGSRKVVAYNQSMRDQLDRKKELERAIRKAINNDELSLHFQPQVDLRTHQIVGVEALVRWESENGNIVSPDIIINTAEETGLMQRLGHWVVDNALKQFSEMLDERCAPRILAINVSGREFQDGYLADYIIRAINRYDIPPSRIQIELTEQVFIENLERNQHILNRLTSTGIGLAIDDFGTGYSSLAYLKHFPVNTVKIDRGFIKDLPESKDDLVICQAVVSMANLLQLKVVAEGIETIEQQELLRNIGCNYAQGHYYYTSMPAAELMVLLKKQRAGRLYPTP